MLSIARQLRSPCARAAAYSLMVTPARRRRRPACTSTTTFVANHTALRRPLENDTTVVKKYAAIVTAARRAMATGGASPESDDASTSLQKAIISNHERDVNSDRLENDSEDAAVSLVGAASSGLEFREEERVGREPAESKDWLTRARQARDAGALLIEAEDDHDSEIDSDFDSDTDENAEEEEEEEEEDDEDLPTGDWSIAAESDQEDDEIADVETLHALDYDSSSSDSDSDNEAEEEYASEGQSPAAEIEADGSGARGDGLEGTPEAKKKKHPLEMRLSRRIARSGMASRREAERMIEAGEVTVNGQRVLTPALNVGPSDVVRVKKQVLPRPEDHSPRLWMVHKLKGELVARHDPAGRALIFDRLAKLGLPDTLMPVGRLDYNTEGLLLLTNDGDLARKLELPSSNLTRTYSVRVYGNITEEKLTGMRSGVTIDGVRYQGMSVRVEGGGGKGRDGRNAWLTIECSEGKNRQIRKICKYLCLTVNRLARVKFGPFTLGKVRAGGVSRVELKESFLKRLDAGTAGRKNASGLNNGRGRILPGASPGPGARIRKGVGAPVSRGDAFLRKRSVARPRSRANEGAGSRGGGRSMSRPGASGSVSRGSRGGRKLQTARY